MATYLHFAPAIALAAALNLGLHSSNTPLRPDAGATVGTRKISTRLMLCGACAAIVPDFDVISVRLYLDSYSGTYGHRGFTHSVLFAVLLGLIGALFSHKKTGPGQTSRATVWSYLTLCTLSHPVLDSLFDVGICSAWIWPFDGGRYCLPWRPIPMKGIALFGLERLQMELLWIGLPLLLLVNLAWLIKRIIPSAHRAEGSVTNNATDNATGNVNTVNTAKTPFKLRLTKRPSASA